MGHESTGADWEALEKFRMDSGIEAFCEFLSRERDKAFLEGVNSVKDRTGRLAPTDMYFMGHRIYLSVSDSIKPSEEKRLVERFQSFMDNEKC